MEKLNFVLDIGNTHIVAGLYSGTKIICSFRLASDRLKTEDEYFATISSLLNQNGISAISITKAAVCSVVPDLTRVFDHLLNKYFQSEVYIVNSKSKLGLSYPMPDPSYIGADLVVNAYAAQRKYNKNCIVCDLGTATTIQLIGKDGYFWGTVIAPGVITSASHLFSKASKLANIKLEKPGNILGTTTEDALLSGIVTGNAIMLDGFIKKIKEEHKQLGDIISIATGGIAELICSSSTEIDIVDKNLTLDGLNIYCNEK